MVKTLKSRTVVICGGGFTAGLISRQLTAQGIDVLVLERGGDHTGAAEARLPNQRDELRWDVHAGLVQDWSVETYSLRHASSEHALPVRRMEAFLPGEGMGGAANHWNGQTWRWAEYDPMLRTRLEARYGKKAIPPELTVQDWGVTYPELEPYHALWEKLFGISGKAGNIRGQIQPGGNPFEAPRQDEYPQPPLPPTEAGLIFSKAAESLGHKPFPMAAANSPNAYTNPDGMQLGQCQFCGHCERFICEANAKASPEVLLYPMLLKRPKFELRLHSHVTRIDYDRKAKRARGVRYVDLLSGEEYLQPADVVILASFTMSNTKHLLVSGIGKPYDPKTGSGVVGKNFCHQTMSGVNVHFKDRWINPFLASGASQTCIDEFNGDNFDHSGLGFFGGGYIYSNTTSGRPITKRLLPPGMPQWGSKWKQANADWYAHSFNIYVHGSWYPHRENYLDLDPTYQDAYGQPLVRMTFDIRENELRMSEYLTGKAAEIARASGATIVGTPSPRKGPYDARVYQTTHVTGGTVMGADPHTSVVSPHLQHWDAENLFVVGASVYPFNAGYNPTGPLGALSLRLGDDLVRYVQRPQML
ncbi:GMC family oxidoreductase [Bradyrhizobium liaoningense]|uniref:GMC family oxidoreductase n=1 Tax=Bradyrhizobium liaoningense TaxID=43992 RepID=UPI001BADE3DC|nr:GMC family oxidoreductase [Bradyrhizobium liaoningense]MBR0906370.1 GMC family oxidoreductase [Bradyrhizobium liaoningense]